jgi:formylglycine-generating enzyme required for sulfatase activity
LVDTRGRPRLRYGSDAQAPADDPSMLETQAARQYAMALDYYRAGQTEQAINFLRDLVSRFPTTSAARDAREALDRLARGLPLFGDAAPKPDPAKPASHASHTGAASSETEPPKAPERKKPVIGIRKPSAPGETPSGDATPTDREDGSDLRDPPPQGSTLARAEMRPRALPPDFLPVDAAGVHSSGWPIEIVCLKDQSHMMLVPSGVFEMGSAAGAENTQPVHRVRLKAYYIDRYEITLGQYKHFLQQRRLQNSPYRDLSVAAFAALSSDKHPVVGVAWRDANVYAEWAGKTLPTEAQWEKAARGTDGRSVPWGKGRPKWERPREPKQIDPVGSYAWDVSIYGCYDMAGNAWEWCSDWYDPDAYLTHPEDDPQGPKESLPPVEHLDLEKTLRGGSAQWEVTWRAPGGLNEEPLHVGFRCVLDVERIIRPTPTPEPQRSSVPQNAVPVPSGGYKF